MPKSKSGSSTRGGFAEFVKALEYKTRPEDLEMVIMAYKLSKVAHQPQVRDDGTRYFDHLKETAWILIDQGVYDPDLIVSCLLHDVVEDQPRFMSREAIAVVFNERIAHIVVAVTKPKKSDPRFPDNQARHTHYFANLQDADNDVLVVKLADRLHNMRTLSSCDPPKQKRKAQETVDVYLPLAEKLAEQGHCIGEYFRDELQKLVIPSFSK